MERSDRAVLESIDANILQAPDVIAATIRKALDRIRPDADAAGAHRIQHEHRLAVVERDLERLTAAITAGGELPTIIEAIRSREAERDTVRGQIAVLDRAGERAQVDVRTIEHELRMKLETWRGLLRKHVP